MCGAVNAICARRSRQVRATTVVVCRKPFSLVRLTETVAFQELAIHARSKPRLRLGTPPSEFVNAETTNNVRKRSSQNKRPSGEDT